MIDFEKLMRDKELDKERFYLLIAGSRGFAMDGSMSYVNGESSVILGNYEVFAGLIDRLIEKSNGKYREIKIIHGDARGVDAMAKRYAMERAYENKEYVAAWDVEGRRAGMLRNQRMYTYLSLKPNKAAVLFWDGESKGTRNNFLQAENYRVKIACYNYLLQRWMTKEEISEVQAEVVNENYRYY